jgi:hypothetical protein
MRIKRTRTELEAMPKPKNPAELEVLSQWYFGAPLHLGGLRVSDEIGTDGAYYGQYEVGELYNDYHGDDWLFGKNCIKGYDYSRDFWRHVVGELYCGGIAASSYGQVRVREHRDQKRLKEFAGYLRRNESGRLRKAFERLALLNGEGENTVTRDSRVQTSGRADGAVAASNVGGAP